MTYKNYDSLELQQKVNEIDNKCEKSYVDEKVNDINSSLEDILILFSSGELVLRSPDNSKWVLKVDNYGQLGVIKKG